MEKVIGGIKRDCYPLTPAQMVHMYTLKFSPTDEVVNIGTGQFLHCAKRFYARFGALQTFLRRAVRGKDNRSRVFLSPRAPFLFRGAPRLKGETTADLFGA